VNYAVGMDTMAPNAEHKPRGSTPCRYHTRCTRRPSDQIRKPAKRPRSPTPVRTPSRPLPEPGTSLAPLDPAVAVHSTPLPFGCEFAPHYRN
jgi:hypothetical protein